MKLNGIINSTLVQYLKYNMKKMKNNITNIIETNKKMKV